MSLTDQTRDDSSIRYVTMQKTLHLLYRCLRRRSTRSSSLTRQITQHPMYNSYLEQVSKNSQTTVDSSLPATTKTKSLSPSIRDAQLSSSPSQENKNQQSLDNSSNDLYPSWTTSGLKLIRKSSQNSSTNTSPIGEESSTNVNDIPLEEK